MGKNVNIVNNENIKGNVKVTLMHGNKEYKKFVGHNKATLALCEYLRDALVADYIIARRPGLIKPCRKDASNNLIPIGTGTPFTSDKKNAYTEEDTGVSATLTFLIPNTNMTAGTQIDGFKLYSKDTSEKEYASISLDSMEGYDPENPLVVSGDVNLKVE